MDYIALISLVLGLISIVITIKYIDSFDKLNYTIKKSCKKKCNKSFPDQLINIQNKLDLTDTEFLELLEKNSDKITSILNKKEEFTNYVPYVSLKDRNIIVNDISGLIKPRKKTKKFNSYSYIDNKKLALDAIKKQQKYSIFPKYTILNNNKKMFLKNNLCLVRHEKKDYCFPTYEKEFCPGIYGSGFKECK